MFIPLVVVANLGAVFRVEQFVHVDNVVAGLGAVYRALSGAAPGFVSLGVVGINAGHGLDSELKELEVVSSNAVGKDPVYEPDPFHNGNAEHQSGKEECSRPNMPTVELEQN